jgi:hypothetical protein
MGDAAEGLVDAEARILERMEEQARSRARASARGPRNPERARILESLRLARIELQRQLDVTTNDTRREQIQRALAELERRVDEAASS